MKRILLNSLSNKNQVLIILIIVCFFAFALATAVLNRETVGSLTFSDQQVTEEGSLDIHPNHLQSQNPIFYSHMLLAQPLHLRWDVNRKIDSGHFVTVQAVVRSNQTIYTTYKCIDCTGSGTQQHHDVLYDPVFSNYNYSGIFNDYYVYSKFTDWSLESKDSQYGGALVFDSAPKKIQSVGFVEEETKDLSLFTTDVNRKKESVTNWDITLRGRADFIGYYSKSIAVSFLYTDLNCYDGDDSMVASIVDQSGNILYKQKLRDLYTHRADCSASSEEVHLYAQDIKPGMYSIIIESVDDINKDEYDWTISDIKTNTNYFVTYGKNIIYNSAPSSIYYATEDQTTVNTYVWYSDATQSVLINGRESTDLSVNDDSQVREQRSLTLNSGEYTIAFEDNIIIDIDHVYSFEKSTFFHPYIFNMFSSDPDILLSAQSYIEKEDDDFISIKKHIPMYRYFGEEYVGAVRVTITPEKTLVPSNKSLDVRPVGVVQNYQLWAGDSFVPPSFDPATNVYDWVMKNATEITPLHVYDPTHILFPSGVNYIYKSYNAAQYLGAADTTFLSDDTLRGGSNWYGLFDSKVSISFTKKDYDYYAGVDSIVVAVIDPKKEEEICREFYLDDIDVDVYDITFECSLPNSGLYQVQISVEDVSSDEYSSDFQIENLEVNTASFVSLQPLACADICSFYTKSTKPINLDVYHWLSNTQTAVKFNSINEQSFSTELQINDSNTKRTVPIFLNEDEYDIVISNPSISIDPLITPIALSKEQYFNPIAAVQTKQASEADLLILDLFHSLLRNITLSLDEVVAE